MIANEGIKYTSSISKKYHMLKQKCFSGINVTINHARIKMLHSKNIHYTTIYGSEEFYSWGAYSYGHITVLRSVAHLNGFLLWRSTRICDSESFTSIIESSNSKTSWRQGPVFQHVSRLSMDRVAMEDMCLQVSRSFRSFSLISRSPRSFRYFENKLFSSIWHLK